MSDTSMDSGNGNLTSTSNMSAGIAQRYGTYSQIASMFKKSRKETFYTATTKYKETEFSNPSIPRSRMPTKYRDTPRQMTGVGEIVDNPMQNFFPEKLALEGRTYSRSVSRPKRVDSANSFRKKGVSAGNREHRRMGSG